MEMVSMTEITKPCLNLRQIEYYCQRETWNAVRDPISIKEDQTCAASWLQLQ